MVIASLCIILFLFFLAFTPYTYAGDFDGHFEQLIFRADMSEHPDRGELTARLPSGGLLKSAAVIGATEGNATKTVVDTLKMKRIEFALYPDISDIQGEKTVVFTKTEIDENDLEMVKTHLSNGGHVIFAVMPDVTNENLRDFLGIKFYGPFYQAVGFTVYDGIFINGMQHNSDFPFVHAEVELYSRAKVFANSYSKAVSDEIEEMPTRIEYPDKSPMIWRVVYEGGDAYVLNTPFMESFAGVGLLSGVLALCYEDIIYPVVGTRTVGLLNFPYIYGEFETLNTRTSFAYTRDIIWPGLLSMAKNMNLSYTCYTTGNFQGDNEVGTTLNFILDELVRVNHSELAYKLTDETRMERDMEYLGGEFPNILIRSLIVPEFDNYFPLKQEVTAISARAQFDGFFWLNDHAVNLPITGTSVNLGENLFTHESFITAFGYANHNIDMEPVFLDGGSANDYMQTLGRKLFELFGRRYYLEPVSAREAAEQVKNYLNIEMATSYSEARVAVALSGFDKQAKFILRTTKAVDFSSSSGCKIMKIGEGVYLVTANGGQFEIKFKPELSHRWIDSPRHSSQ